VAEAPAALAPSHPSTSLFASAISTATSATVCELGKTMEQYLNQWTNQNSDLMADENHLRNRMDSHDTIGVIEQVQTSNQDNYLSLCACKLQVDMQYFPILQVPKQPVQMRKL
jgi:hypothetical protein